MFPKVAAAAEECLAFDLFEVLLGPLNTMSDIPFVTGSK